MEKVVIVDSRVVAPLVNGGRLPIAFPGSAFQEGVVQGTLGSSRYNVVLEGGLRIQVRSATALNPGDKVQVMLPKQVRGIPEPPVEAGLEALNDGSILSAFMPLAFGGPKANAKLEVHIERQSKEGFKKGSPVVYFVFTVRTAGQGEIHWGVHLNGRQIALQVYAPHVEKQGETLRHLVNEVERALSDRGFVVSGKVIIARHPLRKPSDSRLNLRG